MFVNFATFNEKRLKNLLLFSLLTRLEYQYQPFGLIGLLTQNYLHQTSRTDTRRPGGLCIPFHRTEVHRGPSSLHLSRCKFRKFLTN